jgi:hypothetical protein
LVRLLSFRNGPSLVVATSEETSENRYAQLF